MSPRTRGPLVVVGDALLDVDLEGSATRLCPDAPVPVVDDAVAWPRAGGAGLAAALAAADGHEVVLVSTVADDEDGRRLARLLAAARVRLVGLPHDGTTSVKKRVRVGGQSLLRLDTGHPGTVDLPGAVRDAVLDVLDRAGAVLVSDYGRGTADVPEVRGALARAAQRVPLVWDPHPRGQAPVPGARLVTPNRDEATAAASACDTTGLGPLAATSARAEHLVGLWAAHGVAITLGPQGALLSHGGSSPSVLPARRVDAPDPCGAGDRFASAAAGALLSGALPTEAVQVAVAAAADFVAAGGAAALARPTAEAGGAHGPDDVVARVRAAGGTVVATGGCFDLLHAGHVATLEAARALGDCLVVCLNSDASVRRLKGETRPLVAEADRARVLAALAAVDAVVVFDEDTPREALARLRPDVWVKGGDYAGADLPEAPLLRSWGGQSVVLPYLEGRSTTGLVATASGARPPSSEPG